MYDDLIEKLRADEIPLDELVYIIHEAADAIEELSKPKWIPVTDRPPEAESGSASKPVLVTDGDCMAIAEWVNCKLSEPYWSYTGTDDITHWMPLPQLPKGE